MTLRRLVIGGLLLVTVLAVVDVRAGGPSVLGRYFEQVTGPLGPAANDGTGSEELSEPGGEVFSFTVSDSSSIDARGVSALTVTNARGNITVTGSALHQVDVQSTVTVWADSEDAARSYARALRPGFRVQGPSVSLGTTQQEVPHDSGLRGARVDHVLALPSGVNLSITNALGTVDVTGVGADVTVRNRFGGVAVSNVRGAVRLDCASGRAGGQTADPSRNPKAGGDGAGDGASYTVSDVKGDVTANIGFGTLDIRRVDGSVKATCAYGDTRVQDVSGSAELHSSFGDLEISSVVGPIAAQSLYGSIAASRVSNSARLTAANGSVSVGLVRRARGYSVNATAIAGRITTNLPLPVVRSEAERRESLKGAVEAGETEVSARSTYGDVSVTLE